MKKQLLVLSLLGAMGLTASAQFIPNGDFESWVTIEVADQVGADPLERAPYQELGPNKNLHQNFLRTINEAVGGFDAVVAPPLTAYRSPVAKSGQYSIRLQSATKTGIFVPGVFTSGDMINVGDPNTVGVHLGRPYPYYYQATNFEGWYQYDPAGGDSALFQVYFLKNSVEIGRGEFIEKNKQENWTKFDIAINWTTAERPDSIVIIVSASAAINFVNLFECKGEVGSQLYVDDINLVGPGIGVKESDFNQISASIFPIPAVENFTLAIKEVSDNMLLQVFDLSGKKVIENKIVNTNTVVSTNQLNAGVYIVSVVENGAKVFTKKVIVK